MQGRMWLIGAMLFVVPLSANGQAEGIPVGARVRVTSPADNMKGTVGTVAEVRNDSMIVVGKGGSRAVPLANITGLDVSTGRRSRVLRDAALGLGVGAIAGAALGYSTYEECTPAGGLFDCFLHPESSGQAARGAGIVGGALGLLVGALVGVFDRADRWQSVDVPARVAISPISGGRVAVRLSRAF